MKLKKWNGSYRLLIKLIYDHNGEMYEIELEDGSTLLVSPEHNVYGLVGQTQERIQ
jgi:hypothetical protein